MSQTPHHATGPRTDAGKQRSSQNSLQHGLAAGRLLIPGENPAHFESLLADLLEEHQPATPTETLLVHDLAKSHWLKERALRFQAQAFETGEPDLKKLSLFLRYQTASERSFHKSLQSLRDLQNERTAAHREFVSQNAESDEENLPDTPEALDRDMKKIQQRLIVFMENNPENAARAKQDPELARYLDLGGPTLDEDAA